MIHKQTPTRDDDPSDMTDFEKNTTEGELEQVVPLPNAAEPGQTPGEAEQKRQERGNRGPKDEPGFGQGA